MTTDAIEAGARAINAHWSEDAGWDTPFDDTEREYQAHCRSTAKSCIEAAIASGELVPASAVAAERERCIQAVRDERLIDPVDSYDQVYNKALDHAEHALRALSPEPASGEWRDISTALDDGTEILGYWRGSKTYAIISWSIDGWWKDNADHSAVSPPTHWMPLPEPPVMLNAAGKDGSGAK